MSATATPESPSATACVQFSLDDLLALGRLSRIVHGVDVARQSIRGILLRSARSDGWGRAIATDGRVLSVASICRPNTSTAIRGPITAYPLDLSPWDGHLIPYSACEWLRTHCGTLAACRRVLGDVSLRGPGPGHEAQIVLGGAAHDMAPTMYPDCASLFEGVKREWHYCVGPRLSAEVASLVEEVATPPKASGRNAADPVCPSPYSAAYGDMSVFLSTGLVTLAMPLALPKGSPDRKTRREFAKKFPPASETWASSVAAILDMAPYSYPA